MVQCAADCLHGDIVTAHARTCVGLCGVYAVSAVHAYTRSTLPPLQLSLSSFQWSPPSSMSRSVLIIHIILNTSCIIVRILGLTITIVLE